VKRAKSAEDFATDPVDRYWLGATQLVWCRSPRLCGSLHWGRPREPDVAELTRALELARHPALAAGFEVFMDSSALERVDWSAYLQLLSFVRERVAEWSGRIRRHAVIVRPGPTAALLAGMAPLVGLAYPMRFVADRESALRWLGWTERLDALAAVDETSRIAGEARGQPPVVQRLRGWLERSLIGASVDAAAGGLGMSVRSLQRELREAGTCFTAEVHTARIRVACELLGDTDDKIEVIARAVGSASTSQLCAMFRRHLGLTPARYRAALASKAPSIVRESIAG